MELRTLGRSELKVPPLAFGGNIFGWTVDEAQSFRLLDQCLEAGLNFIDTADVYSRWVPGHQGGESETIIGHWLKKSGKRNKVILATKVGMNKNAAGRGLSRQQIIDGVEGSLKRLGVDSIDLFQSHQDDDKTPLEETLSTYGELIKQGKLKVIGASNYSAARLEEALDLAEKKGLPRYESLQPHYNLIDRGDFEGDLETLCLERKVGVIPYFSLASGFLTGKYRSAADKDKSARGGGMDKYLNARGFKVLDALDAVAKEHRSTPAAVSLAWLIARPSITAPIASATRSEQVESLIAATKLKLTKADIDLLTQAGR